MPRARYPSPGAHAYIAAARVLISALACACGHTEIVAAYPDELIGAGLELTLREDTPTVVRVLSGGSAEEAGVRTDDRILEVDGVATRGMSLGDVVMKIRGKAGTQLTLTIDRRGDRVITVIKRRRMLKESEDYRAAQK